MPELVDENHEAENEDRRNVCQHQKSSITCRRAEASAEHFGQAEDSTAQVSTEREMEFALDARETDELRMVDAALRRIDASSYGQCIDCGVEIPAARLHAAPEAARCIACQEKVE